GRREMRNALANAGCIPVDDDNRRSQWRKDQWLAAAVIRQLLLGGPLQPASVDEGLVRWLWTRLAPAPPPVRGAGRTAGAPGLLGPGPAACGPQDPPAGTTPVSDPGGGVRPGDDPVPRLAVHGRQGPRRHAGPPAGGRPRPTEEGGSVGRIPVPRRAPERGGV